jgi:Ca2+-transporting ATPase
MRRPPRPAGAPLLSPLVLRRTVMASLLMTAGAVGFFLYEWRRGLASGDAPALALAEAQTMAVTAVIFFQVFYLLESRSLTELAVRGNPFSNPALLPGIGAVLALQAAFIWWPPLQAIFGTASLEPAEVGSAALVAAVIFPAMLIEKAVTRRSRAAA